MFKHKKLEELELMYNVFSRVETTLKFILDEMQPYIQDRGRIIVKDEELLKQPVEFTKKLLELKKEMDEMVETAFKNNMKFQKARDTSFTNFMNEQQVTAQYIAAHCDNEFKKGLKGVSEAETD